MEIQFGVFNFLFVKLTFNGRLDIFTKDVHDTIPGFFLRKKNMKGIVVLSLCIIIKLMISGLNFLTIPKAYINRTITNHFSHPVLLRTKQNCTLKTEGQKDGVQQNLFGTCDGDDWWSVGLESVLLQGILYQRLMRGSCSWYILKIWVQDV